MADKGGYIGRNPGDSQVTIARQQFTPTGVTTDFTFTSGYTVGYMDVYINGSKILLGRDYTAQNGTTVGLTSAAQNGDIVELVAYKAFNVSNVSESNGNFDVNGILTVDDNTTLSGQLEVAGVSTFASNVENVVSSGIITAPTFSGNITGTGATFTDGTFSGNVDVTGNITIGGTLTYEDVTNIDSVGLVTARKGVRITAGGLVVTAGVSTFTDDVKVNSTLTASEGLHVSAGIVTVASQLNVGSNIKAGSAGVVTATSFSGSGANLTGISAGLSTDEYENTSGGINALDSLSAGNATDNTAIGYDALTANTTGDGNTGIGASALTANTTANDNTAIGFLALATNTTGATNTALGRSALKANTTASYNTCLLYTSPSPRDS